jgi:hypothetical protein
MLRCLLVAVALWLGCAAPPAWAGWWQLDPEEPVGTGSGSQWSNHPVWPYEYTYEGAPGGGSANRGGFVGSGTYTYRFVWVDDGYYWYDEETGEEYYLEDPPRAEAWEVGFDVGFNFSYDPWASEPGNANLSVTVTGPDGTTRSASASATGTPELWEYEYDGEGGETSRQISQYSFTQTREGDTDFCFGFVLDGPEREITITVGVQVEGTATGDMQGDLELVRRNAGPGIEGIHFTHPNPNQEPPPSFKGSAIVVGRGLWSGTRNVNYHIRRGWHGPGSDQVPGNVDGWANQGDLTVRGNGQPQDFSMVGVQASLDRVYTLSAALWRFNRVQGRPDDYVCHNRTEFTGGK